MSSSFEFGDWIFLLTSIFEMLMFCGFQSGWSSLVYVLVEEGIYSHLCAGEDLNPIDGVPLWNSTNSTSPVQITRTIKNNCVAQQEMLNLAYTLATSVSSLVAFPIGVAMDSIGPRFTRIISGFLLGFSSFLLSYLNKQKPGLLFIGLIVACISNLMIFMTPQACMQRFKKGRSVLIGLYCGAWGASSLTVLGFKVLYEHGGVGLPHFFRFLSVGCVFLCINAALLYPDSAIPPAEEKSKSKKEIIQCKFFKKHNQLTCIREELTKYKFCLRHMINGRKDTSNPVKSERTSEEWNQLIPNVVISSVECSQTSTDVNSANQTDQAFTKTKLEGERMQPIRAKTVLDLSKSQNLSLNVLGPCCDIKRITYAECPSMHPCDSQKDNVKQLGESCDLMKPYDSTVDDKPCQTLDKKTPNVLTKACEEKEREIHKLDQKPSESKDTLDSRSTDLQVWTANSAASYLKSGLSFKHCVVSTLHILAQVFITVCKIRTWFFVGTFSNFISDLSGGDRATVATYVNIFGLSHVGALVMGPLFGYIIDRQCSQNTDESIKPSKETEKQHQKFMMDIEASPKAIDFIIQCNRRVILKLNDAVLVTASATVLFCLLTLIPNLILQIVTFQLFVFVKFAFDTVFASILIIIFPQNHLGKLMGLAALIGAVFSLIQYPLFVAMEVWFGGRTIEVNIILWLLCLFAFGFPIYLWRKASRQKPHSLALVAV